jgi:hypothetical protein
MDMLLIPDYYELFGKSDLTYGKLTADVSLVVIVQFFIAINSELHAFENDRSTLTLVIRIGFQLPV